MLSNIEAELFNPATLAGALFYALLAAALSFVAAVAVRSAVLRSVKRRPDRVDRGMALFMVQLCQIGIFVTAAILYVHLIPDLRAIGTAMLAGVSVASVVIGIAAQNTLGNLVAGVSLLLYRPFKTGDRIVVDAPGGNETGIVENVTLGYTVVQTWDNRRIVLPNSAFASQTIINLTSVEPRVMAFVPVSIAYHADVARARALLLGVGSRSRFVHEVVDCPVTELGDSSVVLTLRAWCPDPITAREFGYQVIEEAKAEFHREGIEIPYPYHNVVLKGGVQPQAA
jgi:small-conductance mechanosensitive channel